jgi:hypothetical protein
MPAKSGGLAVVELVSGPLTEAPISYPLVEELLAARPELRLGGQPLTPASFVHWLQEMWLPDERVLSIRRSTFELPWLLRALDCDLVVHYARAARPSRAARNARVCFASRVSGESRGRRAAWEQQPMLPVADISLSGRTARAPTVAGKGRSIPVRQRAQLSDDTVRRNATSTGFVKNRARAGHRGPRISRP